MRFLAVLTLAAAACGGGSAPAADGTIEAWVELEAMPVARSNHCSAVVGGLLVAIGGNYKPEGSDSFMRLDAVHGAPVNDDGTLGPWTQIGAAPSPVTECTAVGAGDRLYLLDGLYDVDTQGGHVFSATLGADGLLSPFVEVGPLPNGRRVLTSEAWVKDGVLYAVGGSLPEEDDVIFALHASLDGDALGEWTEDDWLPGWRGAPQHAFDGGHVFTLGGYLGADLGNVTTTAVSRGPLADDGAVMPAVDDTALPVPTIFGEAVAVDAWVYLVGGRPALSGAASEARVWSAPIEDAALGAWTAQAPLPAPRTNHELARAGDFLFVVGGGNEGPGLPTVFGARVRN